MDPKEPNGKERWLRLDKLDEEIRKREERNTKLSFDEEPGRILMPYGYTGAGKTTFILYSAGIPLTQLEDEAGTPKYGAAEKLPPELEHLEVGNMKPGESCTVYVSCTKCNGFVFLDAPGFKDTGGPTKDVANTVALHSIMKKIPAVTPVLFIEHPHFSVYRGDGIRDLIQGFSAMWNHDIKALEQCLVVVFTKVRPGVTLKAIAKEIRDLADADAEGNTDEVLDILDLIEKGINRDQKSSSRREPPLAGRVLIFDPLDTSSQDRLIRNLESSRWKQLENPSDLFQVQLQPQTQTQLDAAMLQLRGQIEIWMKQKKTGDVLKQVILLKKLSVTIPAVEETFRHCTTSLCNSLVDKVKDAKSIHFPSLLQIGEVLNTSCLERFKDTRDLLESVEDLRELKFLDPVESLKDFDEWTLIQFKVFMNQIESERSFVKIAAGLDRIQVLSTPFKYLKGFSDAYSNLNESVKKTIASLQKDLQKCINDLSKDNVEELVGNLKLLHEAAKELPSFVDMAKFQDVLLNLLEEQLNSISKGLIGYLSGPPNPPLEKEKLESYLTLKVACLHKSLPLLLPPTPDSVLSPTTYLEARSQCLKVAQNALDRLNQVATTANALNSTNESIIVLAKAIGDFDPEIKTHVDQELIRSIVAFDSKVDQLLYQLQEQVIYNANGPNFHIVPEVFRKLDACAWLDSYAHGGIRRIENKKEEAREHLDLSLTNLGSKIELCFKRGRYTEALNLYDNLDKLGEIPLFPMVVKSYEEQKAKVTQKLQDAILGAVNEKTPEDNCPLPNADAYLGHLNKFVALAGAVGVTKVEDEQKRMIADLNQRATNILRNISAPNEHKWEEYRDIFYDLETVQNPKDYPYIPDAVRNCLQKATANCLAKVEALSTKIKTLCGMNVLVEVPALLTTLNGAFALAPYLKDVSRYISEAERANGNIEFENIEKIKENFTAGQYFACKLVIDNLPHEEKTFRDAIRFLTTSLLQMASTIKHDITLLPLQQDEKWQDVLARKIAFESTQALFVAWIPELLWQKALQDIYSTFDNKLEVELKGMESQGLATEENLAETQKKLLELGKMSNDFGPSSSLPKSKDAWDRQKHSLKSTFEDMEKQIATLDLQNVHDVDTFYSNLVDQKHYRKNHYFQLIRAKLGSYAQEVDAAKTIEECQQKLARLHGLAVAFQAPDLKQVAVEEDKQASNRAAERGRKRETEFDSFLMNQEFSEMNDWFVRFQHDIRATTEAKTKMVKHAFQFLVLSLPNNASDADLELFRKNVEQFIAFEKAFPAIISKVLLDKPKTLVKQFFESRQKQLREICDGDTSLFPLGQLLPRAATAIQQILSIKSVDQHLQFNVIPERDFAEVLAPYCKIFQANQEALDVGILQSNFVLLYDTLKILEEMDPLYIALHSYVTGKQQLATDVKPLAAILANCLGYFKAMGKVQLWLKDTASRLETQWNTQEYNPLVKSLQSIGSPSAVRLCGLFPNLGLYKSLEQALSRINELYDTLAQRTHLQFSNRQWKEFRDSFDMLERLTEIEVVLKKNASTQIREAMKRLILDIASCNLEDPNQVQNALCELNQLGQDVPQLKNEVDYFSNDILVKIQAKPRGGDVIYSLGRALDQIEGTRAKNAKDIIASFKVFTAIAREVWYQKTQGQDIHWALGDDAKGNPRFAYSQTLEMGSASPSIWLLETCYQYAVGAVGEDQKQIWLRMYAQFDRDFKEYYEHSVGSIVESTKKYFKRKDFGSKLVPILAGICAVWSKKAGEAPTHQATSKTTRRLIPHPIQVLCFFRLLETTKDNKYYSQLIEVLTGEGKSVVLGVVATYFALCGFDVYSICYSDYLSKRDYQDFLEVFEAYGVQKQINYSTISDMCETILNQEGNVRDLAQLVIQSASSKPTSRPVLPTQRPRVLLIDEVDTFFGPDFYGSTYNPATLISNEQTYEILKFIFNNPKGLDFQTVSKTKAYLELVEIFPKLKPLINHEIHKMLKEVQDFEKTPERPVVIQDIILYKEQDDMTAKKVYGYKTAFQYLNFFKLGEIKDEKNVKSHIGLYIGCGNFSFAEIPRFDFEVKMGVSGTLRSLTQKEKEIIQSYGIQRLAFAPSIYGGSRLNEKSEIGRVSSITMVQEKNDWFLRIAQNAQDKQLIGRSVLIFFENIEVLNEFKAAKGGIKQLQCLHEEEKYKPRVIKEATVSGTVTLCTRPFGRGVDFICRDPATTEAGGVHVIQTFVAVSEAEQIQIKGRAARQGDPGSHEFILSYEMLVKYMGPKEGEPDISGFKDFQHDSGLSVVELGAKLDKLRNELYLTSVSELETKRTDAFVAHELTTRFHKELVAYDCSDASRGRITDLIMDMNQASLTSATSNYHIYFCLDESGSMQGAPWNELIKAVGIFISKRIEMCHQNGAVVGDVVTVVNYANSGRTVFKNEPLALNLESKIRPKSGGTNFAAGLNVVEQEMTAQKDPKLVPCLVFMSDGGCSNGKAEMERIRANFPNMKLFVVGFGSGCNRDKMTALAQVGGGEFFFGADGPSLAAEFSAISVKISGGLRM